MQKKKNAPKIWKYSEAFLKAYDNRAVGTICSKYKSALKIDYNVQDIIVFIEAIIKKEPSRIGLFLALGILYDFIGDNELAQENTRKAIYLIIENGHSKRYESFQDYYNKLDAICNKKRASELTLFREKERKKMYPIGNYNRLEHELYVAEEKYGNDPITFGILFVDARQEEARGYIVNYLNSFDKKSGKYFDFYIPGYAEFGDGKPDVEIERTGRGYYFHPRYFDEFCEWAERNLCVEYCYNPMLVLVSVRGGRLGEAEKMVIHLDDLSNHGVRRSGVLFKEIFKIAQKDTTMEGIQQNMEKMYVKGNIYDSIINSLGQDWLVELKKNYNGLRMFRIVGKQMENI